MGCSQRKDAAAVERIAGFQTRGRFQNRGLTLVEVLAALLVIAIGVIGVAALHGETRQSEPETHPQIQAARLAQHMADRVQSNAEGRTGYANVIGVVCPEQKDTEQKDPRPASAAEEAACWHEDIRKQLPNGTGAITRDLSTAPPTYVVSVSWSAIGTGAASYVVRVQPATD